MGQGRLSSLSEVLASRAIVVSEGQLRLHALCAMVQCFMFGLEDVRVQDATTPG